MEFTIAPARYAKGKLVVSCPASPDGFKTQIHWLVENVGGQWVHRSKGYHVTVNQAVNLVRLMAAGWHGCCRIGKDQPAMFTKDGVTKFSLIDALKNLYEKQPPH